MFSRLSRLLVGVLLGMRGFLRGLLYTLFWGSTRFGVFKVLLLAGMVLAWIVRLLVYEWFPTDTITGILSLIYLIVAVIQFWHRLYVYPFIVWFVFVIVGINYLFAGITFHDSQRGLFGISLLIGVYVLFAPSFVPLRYPLVLNQPTYATGLLLLYLGFILLTFERAQIISGFGGPITALFTAGAVSVVEGLHLVAHVPRFVLTRVEKHEFQVSCVKYSAVLYRFFIYLKNMGRRMARGTVARLVLDFEESRNRGVKDLIIAERQTVSWVRCRKNGTNCPLRQSGCCSTVFLSPPASLINEYLPWLSAVPVRRVGKVSYYHLGMVAPGAEEGVGLLEIWKLHGFGMVVRFYSEQGVEDPESSPQPRICLLIDRPSVSISFKVAVYADNADPLMVDCTLTIESSQASLKCSEQGEDTAAITAFVPLT